ncbi:Fe-S oxidoreductase [Candidatus Magnetomorum sp. HK-1]|nr:Fe-S oxidoreductase [Candidatus Magnetomorum sp. HK-1]
MTKEIDCFIIGHNPQPIEEIEKKFKKLGTDAHALRNFELFTLRYDNKPYRIKEYLDTFYCKNNTLPTLNMGEVFSNTVAYLCTFLHRRGFTFDYVNSIQDEKEELAKKLAQENILTIAITTTLYDTPFPIIEIIRFIKKYNTSAKIIIGGPYIFSQVRTLPFNEMESQLQLFEADFIVNSHQGESALVNIIKSLKQNLPLKQIHNIWFKTPEGYIATPLLPEDNTLEENMIKWDLFSSKIGRLVNIRTATGCPFSCAFCIYPEMNTKKHRYVSVKAMEKELNSLNEINSLKHIVFIDDTFNVPPEEFKKKLRMLSRNKYKFKWLSLFRCQFADEETVKLMKETGCSIVFLGLESGNDQILKNMNKKVTVEEYRRGVALLKKYDILTLGSFVIGFPGETQETITDTVNFINDIGLDFYNPNLWFCSHLTPIWENRQSYQLEGNGLDWKHQTMDSKTAADHIEKIVLSVDDQTALIRDGRFDIELIPFLLDRGMSVKEIKAALQAFTGEIKKQLTR